MDDSKTGDTDTGRGRARRLMAEVLTIVVGILLALSADQWVERRTERGIGMEYLERIERDLVADSAGMANDIARLGHQIAALDTILTDFMTPAARRGAPVRFAVQLLTSQPATVGDFRLATHDDLLNTGNLRLLGGLDLRSRIVDYFGNSREVAARVLDHVAGDPYQAVHLELFAAMPDGILQVTRRGHLDDWDPAPLLDAADRLPDMRTAQRIRWHNAHNEMRALVGHAEANARLLEAVRMALSG